MRFLSALRFLTVLPLPWRKEDAGGATARSLGYFPLVGLLLGLILAGLDRVLGLVFPPAVTGALLATALVGLTGALHLDGFIDTCDGLASRGNAADKKVAMRDSRAGAIGVVGGVMILLLKYSALVSLPGPWRFAGLALMPVFGRCAMVYAIQAFPYARPQGLGRIFKDSARPIDLLAAGALTLALAVVFFRLEGVALFLGALFVAWLWSGFLARSFDGLTGDNYGAVNEAVEVAVLLMVILFSGIHWEALWAIRF